VSISALRPNDPKAVGPYIVTARLGAGAMGVVFLGHDADGAPVAVKTLPVGVGRDVRQRLHREAELLEHVRHPRLAELIAADTDAETPWLAMRYVSGPSLAEVPLPLAEPVLHQLADGLGQALEAVHGAGIVHRDVKPGNVILAYDGPVLVDLGIAARRDLTAMTVAGMVVGTPAFMAPEQLRGETLTSSVDTWGWGVVLTYAATGRAPFGDDAVPAMAYRIQHAPADTATLPPWLRPAVEAALTKNPIQRPTAVGLTAAINGNIAALNMQFDSPATVGMGSVAPEAVTVSEFANRGAARPDATVAISRSPATRTTPAEGDPVVRPRTARVLLPIGIVLVLAAAVAVGVALTRPRDHPSAGSDGLPTAAASSTRSSIQSSTETASHTSTGATSPSTTPTSTPKPPPITPVWPALVDTLVAKATGSSVPAFPTSVQGYTLARSKTAITRTFVQSLSDWDTVFDFPVTMNGCAQHRFFIRWRALDTNATVNATFVSSDTPPLVEKTPVSGAVGWMSGNGCGQPGFHMAFEESGGGNLTDVAVTYKVWSASA
jgi:serine/threonine protein kinase